MSALFFFITTALAGPLDLPDLSGTVRPQNSWVVPDTIIIAGAQRTSPEAMAAWLVALDDEPAVLLLDLSAVPYFVPRAAVRAQLAATFPGEVSVLCDWAGSAHDALGLSDGALVEVAWVRAGGAVELLAAGPVNEQTVAAARARMVRP